MDGFGIVTAAAALLAAGLGATGALWLAETLPTWRQRAAGQSGSTGTAAALAVDASERRPATHRRGARAVMVAGILAATLLLFAAVFQPGSQSGSQPGLPLGPAVRLWLFTLALAAIAVIDLEHRLVLNVMLGPLAVLALVLNSVYGPGLGATLTGGAFGLGLFMVVGIIGRGKLGAGDVKLAGVIGLMVGWPGVMAALLLGVVLGGLAALLLLVSRRATRKSSMAYAPYLVAGALWVLWLPLLLQWKG